EWIPAARAHHIEMQFVAPDESVWIDADPLLLEELLGNLIDNALRYGVGGQCVRLQVGATPPSLSVEDDGPGVDSADSDRIFEAFYRSPRANIDGSGLGLAIVREIARAHGAWWSLTSRPAFSGTRVSVVFPGPRMGAKLTRQE
ncbi:MAG TPA: HAMP domain-containing sensor histidine kinase, partial [Eoetvoesiella sp.]